MANVTFDGPNKLIICNSGTTLLSVQDTYSYWKEWLLLSDNSKYLQAMSIVGGDPTVSGKYLGTTYFLENGWKIRPQSSNHTLTVEGNLYARTGSAFVACIGSYNVQVIQTVSNLIDTVSTGGGSAPSAEEVTNALLNAQGASYTADGSIGKAIMTAGAGGLDPDLVTKIEDLHHEAFGKWVLDTALDTLTLYKEDGSTLKVFSLTKTTGEVSSYVERTPQ